MSESNATPVAWRVQQDGVGTWYTPSQSGANKWAASGAIVTPLYTAPVRAALAELVACKDLKDRAEQAVRASSVGSHQLLAEYKRRQPLAWAAARAALHQEQTP
jgi:hypothetical protein